MDGQGTSGRTQTEKGHLQNVGKGSGHLRRIQEYCQSMVGMCQGKQRPTWN